MGLLSDLSWQFAWGITALLLVSYVVRTIYSVYFGPLAKFPGPKLAASTLLYEFYYDLICKGQYTWKIKELHQKYGTYDFTLSQLFIAQQLTLTCRRANHPYQSMGTAHRRSRLLRGIVLITTTPQSIWLVCRPIWPPR